jgi:ribosomal protein S18 acetylase RimI-like enzyme
VQRGWHGRGVAQALMARVVAEAVAAGANTLWLGVWEHNHRARAFYGKCGFADVGEHVFLFGTDPQTDRVMVKPL